MLEKIQTFSLLLLQVFSCERLGIGANSMCVNFMWVFEWSYQGSSTLLLRVSLFLLPINYHCLNLVSQSLVNDDIAKEKNVIRWNCIHWIFLFVCLMIFPFVDCCIVSSTSNCLSQSPSLSTTTTWRANQRRKCSSHCRASRCRDCRAGRDANVSPSVDDCRTKRAPLPSRCRGFQLDLLSPDSSASSWWRKPFQAQVGPKSRWKCVSYDDDPSCSRASSVDS